MTATAPGLPDGPLVAFYGDDFTGSASVMEVMTFAGLPTVLFLQPPTADQLARYSGMRAIGIAGIARSKSPEWMDEHLPPIFAALEAMRAPVTHYKVCSTLDSSPLVGSIGRAADIGAGTMRRRAGAARWQPVIIAAPGIRRLQAFGNLFAGHGDEWHRLDRHPVMSRHPVTPMHEADVRRHLAEQTRRRVGLVDLADIKSGGGLARLGRALAAGDDLIAIDVVDEETLAWAGQTIWQMREAGIFAIGSQGVEYALIAHWRRAGVLPAAVAPSPAGARETIIAVSGSVSSVTAQQIAWACDNGFELVTLDTALAVDDGAWAGETARAAARAKAILAAGRSPLVASARGPDDPVVARLAAARESSGTGSEIINERIGSGLGSIAATLLRQTGVRRLVISGGDTSGHATRALGIDALTAMSPMGPGSVLSRADAADPAMDGIEIALKGGQMGAPDFFGAVRAGRAGS